MRISSKWKQQQERATSIQKMQDRMIAIEKELESAEIDRRQALGDKALNLFQQIDETYSQMTDGYRQQVVQVNHRMKTMWKRSQNMWLPMPHP